LERAPPDVLAGVFFFALNSLALKHKMNSEKPFFAPAPRLSRGPDKERTSGAAPS